MIITLIVCATAIIIATIYRSVVLRPKHQHSLKVTGVDSRRVEPDLIGQPYWETRILKICSTCGKTKTEKLKGQWSLAELQVFDAPVLEAFRDLT